MNNPYRIPLYPTLKSKLRHNCALPEAERPGCLANGLVVDVGGHGVVVVLPHLQVVVVDPGHWPLPGSVLAGHLDLDLRLLP